MFIHKINSHGNHLYIELSLSYIVLLSLFSSPVFLLYSDIFYKSMKQGICLLSIIPLRRDPSEKSEMVSQLLFGEAYEITEKDLSMV